MTVLLNSSEKADIDLIAATGLARDWCENILGFDPRVRVRDIGQGWEGCQMQIGRSFDAQVLVVGDGEYKCGFCTHANSEFVIESDVAMSRFEAVVGLDRNTFTLLPEKVTCRVIFTLEVHGQEFWRSVDLGIDDAGMAVALALPDATTAIKLRAFYAGADASRGHANWAAPWVTLCDGSRIRLGVPLLPAVPFSFIYDGHSSGTLLKLWSRELAAPIVAEDKRIHKIRWTDALSGLELRMEVTEFVSHPVLEWILFFKNTGTSNTAILEDIQALDCQWEVRKSMHENVGATVHRTRGSTFRVSDFECKEDLLLLNERLEMTAGGGRGSQNWLPFFNVDLGGSGVLTGIGWSGQWACALEHQAKGLRMRVGMERTHLRLLPGEEVRSPRIAQLLWQGDRTVAHNIWRRFVLRHHTPQIEGAPMTGPFTVAHWGGMSTSGQLERIAIYRREQITQEYLWLDAGWYGLHSTYSPDEFAGDWARHVGDWRVNPRAHPDGLRPIVDTAREAGLKFLLWAEPERAIAGTHWVEEHPEWFLGEGDQRLLNLGDPVAFQGLLDFTSKLITENEVAIYRVDFNIDPLAFWRENDTPDRQGVTEIFYNAGLYAFWDALLERHPGLIIDNCASGGRRIDLETISRSIVLWRSDYSCYHDYDPVGTQVQGMGLSYWIPLHGTGTWASTPSGEPHRTYRARSTMGPAFHFSAFIRDSQPIEDDYPWEWHRRMGAEYRRLRPLFVGDYYPLSSQVNSDSTVWAVYQMDRPDIGQGFVMAFRRKKAPWSLGEYPLRGLLPDALYQLENADTGEMLTAKGTVLLQGLSIALPEPESSALFFYQLVDAG